MEILSAVTLMCLASAAAVTLFRGSVLSALEAKTTSRQLSLQLMRARREALASGVNYKLALQRSQGKIIGYGVCPVEASANPSTVLPVPPHIDVISAFEPEFTPAGAPTRSCTLQVVAPNARWRLDVLLATGTVRVTQEK